MFQDSRNKRSVVSCLLRSAAIGVLQHLLVTGGIAEGGVGLTADQQVNVLWLTRIVVVEQHLGQFGQLGFAAFVVAIFSGPGTADDLFGRHAIDVFGINANEVLPPPLTM